MEESPSVQELIDVGILSKISEASFKDVDHGNNPPGEIIAIIS